MGEPCLIQRWDEVQQGLPEGPWHREKGEMHPSPHLPRFVSRQGRALRVDPTNQGRGPGKLMGAWGGGAFLLQLRVWKKQERRQLVSLHLDPQDGASFLLGWREPTLAAS